MSRQLPAQPRYYRASHRANSARDCRARGLNSPYRIASAEFETGFGQAGLQLVLTADIFDPDPRFLAIEGQQLDLANRWYRCKAVTYPQPLSQAGDRNGNRDAGLLVGASGSHRFGAAFDVIRKRLDNAPHEVCLILTGGGVKGSCLRIDKAPRAVAFDADV